MDKSHIDLLKKLAEGNISNDEKWMLERASLDDPFLADALEGFYNHEEHSEKGYILSSKDVKLRERSYLKPLLIAASLLVLLVASFWIYEDSQESVLADASSNPTQRTAQNEVAANQASYSADELKKEEKIETIEEKDRSDESRVISNPTDNANKSASGGYKKQESRSREQVLEETKTKKEQVEVSTTRNSQSDQEFEEEQKEEIKESVQYDDVAAGGFDVQTDKDGVLESAKASREKGPIEKRKSKSMPTTAKLESIPSKFVTGVVRDKNGNPLMGVIVRTEQGDMKVSTDTEGEFEINLDDENDNLNFTYLGFESATMQAQPELSVELKQSQMLLSERIKSKEETMSDAELENLYKEKLDEIFNNQFSLCNHLDKTQSDYMSSKSRVTLFISLNENGYPYRVRTNNANFDMLCKSEIHSVLQEAALDNAFNANRAFEFTYLMKIR